MVISIFVLTMVLGFSPQGGDGARVAATHASAADLLTLRDRSVVQGQILSVDHWTCAAGGISRETRVGRKESPPAPAKVAAGERTRDAAGPGPTAQAAGGLAA